MKLWLRIKGRASASSSRLPPAPCASGRPGAGGDVGASATIADSTSILCTSHLRSLDRNGIAYKDKSTQAMVRAVDFICEGLETSRAGFTEAASRPAASPEF